MNNPPELKARLAFLENQINSIQSALLGTSSSANSNENLPNILSNYSHDQDSLKSILMKLKVEHQMVLKNIEKALELVQTSSNYSPNNTKLRSADLSVHSSSPSPRLRDKISAVLNGTDTDGYNNSYGISSSPSSRRSYTNNNNITNISSFSSPQRQQQKFHHHHSSPLSPSMEKSHITFDILNELEERNEVSNKYSNNDGINKYSNNDAIDKHSNENNNGNDNHRKRVHFMNNVVSGETDLSLASQEYLKKYGLI